MGEPIFDSSGNPIGELVGGVFQASMNGFEAGLLGIFSTIFLGFFALIVGILFVSPFAALYYGFFPTKTPLGLRLLLWVYLGGYLAIAWYVATSLLIY